MIGGLALSAECGDPLQHVFEDDTKWKVVAREMKISSSVFYCHLDLSEWNGIPGTEPMTPHFYRSKIEKGAVMTNVVPELVEGFPTFEPETIARGSIQGDYPKQAVLDWLGYISLGHGNADEENVGELGLSNDASLKELKFLKGNQEIIVNLAQSTGDAFTYIQSEGQETTYSFSSVVATDENAQVSLGEPVTISPNATNGTLYFSVTAEDNTLRYYRINIIKV